MRSIDQSQHDPLMTAGFGNLVNASLPGKSLWVGVRKETGQAEGRDGECFRERGSRPDTADAQPDRHALGRVEDRRAAGRATQRRAGADLCGRRRLHAHSQDPRHRTGQRDSHCCGNWQRRSVSQRAGSSPPGSASCHGSTRPVARRSCSVSASEATATCAKS